MSRDGLLLASSTVGGDREPSAVIFTTLTATVGAAALNQTTLIQLVGAAAIFSQMLTSACSVENRYRPYGSHGAVGRSGRRRNRNRKLNYQSRTATTTGMAACEINYDGGYGTPESSTIIATADVHVTGSSSSTPEMTSSDKPDVINAHEPQAGASMYSSCVDNIPEDDDELLSGRDGRAGSGNHGGGSGSSSSTSSSDTDIDEIVDEFEQRRLAAVAQARADDQLIDVRCANDVTHRRAVRTVVAFTASAFTLFAVVAHAPLTGNPAAVVACVTAGLAAAASAAYLARLPHNDVAMTSSYRPGAGAANSPAVRWVALLSLAAHCCLLAAIGHTSGVVFLIWTTVGLYNNSIIHSVKRIPPPRPLIPQNC